MVDVKKEIVLPINTSKHNMQNKQCNYTTLAIMTLYSSYKQFEEDGSENKYRYLYRDKIIEFTNEIEAMSNNKMNTILKNIKKLSDLDGNLVSACKSKDGKIYYIINYYENHNYVLIHEEMLRVLINSCKPHVVKIYCLLKYLCRNGEKKITRKYIAEQIGLSTKSGSTLNVIMDSINMLNASGFINKRYEYVYDGNTKKCDVYYSVNDYQVWKEIFYRLT